MFAEERKEASGAHGNFGTDAGTDPGSHSCADSSEAKLAGPEVLRKADAEAGELQTAEVHSLVQFLSNSGTDAGIDLHFCTASSTNIGIGSSTNTGTGSSTLGEAPLQRDTATSEQAIKDAGEIQTVLAHAFDTREVLQSYGVIFERSFKEYVSREAC